MPLNLKHNHSIVICLFLVPIISGLLVTPSDVELSSILDSISPKIPQEMSGYSQSNSSPTHSTIPLLVNPTSMPLAPNESSSLFSLSNLLVLYGDYVNESSQETGETWAILFSNLGFNITLSHIDNCPQSPEFDLIVITPSVGTSDTSYGVSQATAQMVVNCSQPILLLGYAHEILDRLYGFNPLNDFIPSVEHYLWAVEDSHQIYSFPHKLPLTNGRYGIYAEQIHYDAYRISLLPLETEVIATNYDKFGAQLLWFRAYPQNTHIYYWGIDQVANLNLNGQQFCENLILWLTRHTLQQRLGNTLASWQLPAISNGDYWELQGAGGFGYPLEPSLRFSYFVVDLVVKNGFNVNLSNFEPWLLSCYDSDFGFFEDMASPQLKDRCITTAMSVLMADDLGILDQFNQTRIGEYLSNCQDSLSGGFFNELDSDQVSITATRYALESLAVLGQLSKINTHAAITYITNCQEQNPSNSEYGGFYSSISGDQSANLVYATQALIALDQIAALNAINQSALISFLALCEEPTGSAIFDTKYTMDADEWVLGTSNAIQILVLLDSLELYNWSASRAFIYENQFSNGGWGRGDILHDFHNSPDETWQGAHALILTGGLGTAEPPLIQYLSTCSTEWGGATEPVIFGDFLTSVDIVMTLSQLDALERMNLTAFLNFLDNSWSQSRTSFVAHQLPSTVGIDTDFPTPDRMALEAGTFGPLYHYAYSQLLSKLKLTTDPWISRATQILEEIKASQTDALGYSGMFGFHHLYVGHETDMTFRFDTTCWNLLAHQALGGHPIDLKNATAALVYLTGCLQTSATHQYFYDLTHMVPLPAPWREAEGYLAETWLGLQAFTYLNPSLSGLDGQKLATYVISYLNENASLITTYYATEILHFLVETGLQLDALNLIDWNNIKQNLLNAFTFTGLVIDTSLPPGKWMPYIENLAMRLINRLHLFPQLDVNPILNLTELTYPIGPVNLGSNVTFSATVVETRWGQLPSTIYALTQIFNSRFINVCNLTPLGYFEFQCTIPLTTGALGPQNLSLTAYAPGAIPDTSQVIDICIGWGKLTLNTLMSPNSQVPRSVPLNITIEPRLEGTFTSNEPFLIGNLSITIKTTSQTFLASYKGQNLYLVTIPTDNLAPISHELQINASIPYCTFHTQTTFVNILVFDTYLTLEEILPTSPILFESTSMTISLWNASGIPLIGYQVLFIINRPGESIPSQVVNSLTDETGIALCSWTPDVAGPWQINYTFSEQAMFSASQNTTTIQINRRPLTCTITVFPSTTLFIGNQSFVQTEVSDALNGSLIPDLLINLYDDNGLVASALTNTDGLAICQWFALAPVGIRELHIEIMATATYEHWSSSPLNYLIRDVTTLLVSSNTTQLYAGEILRLDFQISVYASTPPNGTASVFWDGIWRHDVIISQGFGISIFHISDTESAGLHLVLVVFGHKDAPDSYTECSVTLFINLREIIKPAITLTINPLEIDDPMLTPTIDVHVLLCYVNSSVVHGLSANLTIQIHLQDGTLLIAYSIVSKSSGIGLLTITTPAPGLYTLSVLYKGQRGFAPCSVTSPFLVRNPRSQVGGFFNSLFQFSLALMILGLIAAAFVFRRQQRRLNDFLHHIQPSQNLLTDSSISLSQSSHFLPSNSEAKDKGDSSND